jgi:hypothetical protein
VLGTPTPPLLRALALQLRHGGRSCCSSGGPGKHPGGHRLGFDPGAARARNRPFIWVDTTAFIAAQPVPDLLINALLAPPHAALIWETTTWTAQDGVNPPEPADDYVLANSVGPTCINVPSPTLFGSCTITEADL